MCQHNHRSVQPSRTGPAIVFRLYHTHAVCYLNRIYALATHTHTSQRARGCTWMRHQRTTRRRRARAQIHGPTCAPTCASLQQTRLPRIDYPCAVRTPSIRRAHAHQRACVCEARACVFRTRTELPADAGRAAGRQFATVCAELSSEPDVCVCVCVACSCSFGRLFVRIVVRVVFVVSIRAVLFGARGRCSHATTPSTTSTLHIVYGRRNGRRSAGNYKLCARARSRGHRHGPDWGQFGDRSGSE